jgi:hypothetical protein
VKTWNPWKEERRPRAVDAMQHGEPTTTATSLDTTRRARVQEPKKFVVDKFKKQDAGNRGSRSTLSNTADIDYMAPCSVSWPS